MRAIGAFALSIALAACGSDGAGSPGLRLTRLKLGCVAHDECPSGQLCRGGLCIGGSQPGPDGGTECSADHPCAGSNLQCVAGRCVGACSASQPSGYCAAAAERCVDGACRPSCS